MAGFVASAIAQEHAKSEKAPSAATTAPAPAVNSSATHDGASAERAGDTAKYDRIARLEGEKSFRTNCGRCDTAPHKFPPRVMATAIRHMRVRAMITDEDMSLILRYMTQ
jgi:hypothetical protein